MPPKTTEKKVPAVGMRSSARNKSKSQETPDDVPTPATTSKVSSFTKVTTSKTATTKKADLAPKKTTAAKSKTSTKKATVTTPPPETKPAIPDKITKSATSKRKLAAPEPAPAAPAKKQKAPQVSSEKKDKGQNGVEDAPASMIAIAKRLEKKDCGEPAGSLDSWFNTYADDSNPDELQMEQIGEWLTNGLKISLESSAFYVLGWKMDCQQITTISRSKWVSAMTSLKVKNDSELRKLLTKELETIKPSTTSEQFKKFYNHVFHLLKMSPEAKSLGVDEAMALLSTVLDPATYLISYTSEDAESKKKQVSPFPHAEPFVEFLAEKKPVKVFNKDQWSSFLAFNCQVGPNLEGYSENGAWPSLFDQYVEWRKEKDSISTDATENKD